jgi:hypothetical protein
MNVILDVNDFKDKKEILNVVSKTLDLFNDKRFIKEINSSDDVYVSKIDKSNKIIFKKCECIERNR